jgi:hypothetical protein
VRPIELFTVGIQNLSRKLPDWARVLLDFWILMMIPVMFGWINVPIENAWVRAVVLAPGVLFLLFFFAEIIRHWALLLSWPFRKAVSLWRRAH